jgi:hypothetical protein
VNMQSFMRSFPIRALSESGADGRAGEAGAT